MLFRSLGIFLNVLALGFLVGCSSPMYRQGNLTKAVLEIDAPENFSGVGKNLPKNTSVKNVFVEAKYVPKTKIKMNHVENEALYFGDYDALGASDDFRILPATKIENFYYKRSDFPLAASFTYLKKYEAFIHGFTFGVDPSFFARYILGVNKENYEVGSFLDIGYNSFMKTSLDYYECEKYSRANGCTEISDIRHLEHEGKGRLGLGLFASWFVGGVALSYAPSIYEVEESLNEPGSVGTDELKFRVNLPCVLNQYVGVSSWLDEHWEISIGTTVMSPLNLDDFYFSLNTSAGYWF